METVNLLYSVIVNLCWSVTSCPLGIANLFGDT